MRDRSRLVQQGFTLIELMIVVAIIAILAAIVIPTWTREAQRAKGKSEVTATFAELATKEEQYKVENNVFLDVPTCPAAPTPAGYNFTTTCITAGSNLMLMRVAAPESTMRCSYYVKTGLSSDVLTPPGSFLNSQGAAAAEGALAVSWWWMLATCDEDGQGGTNATYYKSSIDSTLQVANEGT